MPLTQQHRNAFTAQYCLLFYMLVLYKWWNGMFLYQLKPHLYNTRFDLFTWFFMKTGIHTWLLDNPSGWLAFDLAFCSMPLLYFFVSRKNKKTGIAVAAVMLLVNWVYVQAYTLFPANSMESYTAWMLFPVLFLTSSLTGFYYVLQALRYFFLFFFFSAAVWKTVQHGLFNVQEMSGVLLYQHKEYLASSPTEWYSRFIYWLIAHPAVSYLLYLSATIFELAFAVGFFTKKYDIQLLLLFIIFLLMDVFIMRIPYWEVAPYLLTLVYSKYALPADASLQPAPAAKT